MKNKIEQKILEHEQEMQDLKYKLKSIEFKQLENKNLIESAQMEAKQQEAIYMRAAEMD